MTVLTLRDRWRNNQPTHGAWVSLAEPAAAEAAARAGYDYVCIDTQHGGIEYSDAVRMIPLVVLGGSSPIVRVPWNEPGVIGKMLDAGAEGVIVPMVNTAADAEAVVRACRYAPHGGSRSFGPGLAAPRVDGNYVQWSEGNVAVIVMIETQQALDNLDDILAVPGVDAVYVGPADLSLTLGLKPGNNDGEDVFDAALSRIASACAATGIVAGIHSQSAPIARRHQLGFTMQTVAGDLVTLRKGLAASLAEARAAIAGGGDDDAVGGGGLY